MFVVSDMRLEPIPPNTPSASSTTTNPRQTQGTSEPVAAPDSSSNGSGTGGRMDQRAGREDDPTNEVAEGTREGGAGPSLRGEGATVGTMGEGCDSGVGFGGGAAGIEVATKGDRGVSGDGEAEALPRAWVGGGEGIGERYPWVSYRRKWNARRCDVCSTKAAVKMSFGHPLSDQASVFGAVVKRALTCELLGLGVFCRAVHAYGSFDFSRILNYGVSKTKYVILLQ